MREERGMSATAPDRYSLDNVGVVESYATGNDLSFVSATLDDANGQIFNLGSDERINLRDLAALCVEVYGSGTYKIIPFPHDRKPIDIGDYYTDYRKIRGALGWSPRVSLDLCSAVRARVVARSNGTHVG